MSSGLSASRGDTNTPHASPASASAPAAPAAPSAEPSPRTASVLQSGEQFRQVRISVRG